MSLKERTLYSIRNLLYNKGKIVFVNKRVPVKKKDLILSTPKPASIIPHPSLRIQNLALLPQELNLIQEVGCSKFGKYLLFFFTPTLLTVMWATDKDKKIFKKNLTSWQKERDNSSHGEKLANSIICKTNFFAFMNNTTEDEKDSRFLQRTDMFNLNNDKTLNERMAITLNGERSASPEAEQHQQEPESLLQPLVKTNKVLSKAAANIKTKNEEKLGEECKALKDTVAAKTMEIEKLNKINASILEEKEALQEHFQSKKKEIEDRIRLMEAENENTYGEKKSLQEAYDLSMDKLNIAIMEKDRLSEENKDLAKVVSSQGKAVQKLEKEKKALQQKFDKKMAEMNKVNKLYNAEIEEKRDLLKKMMKMKQELEDFDFLDTEADLVNAIKEKETLNAVVQMLEIECDYRKEEASKVQGENNELKNQALLNEELQEQNEALQETLAERDSDLEKISQLYADEVEEKRNLHQEFMNIKSKLEESNNLVGRKEAELGNAINEKQTLTAGCNKLQADYDFHVNQLSIANGEVDRFRKMMDELTKVVNQKNKNEEKLEKEKAALQKAYDEKVLECEKLNTHLSNVGKELHLMSNQLRDLDQIYSDVKTEFDEFKAFFGDGVGGDTRLSVKALIDDLEAGRLRNYELEKLLEEKNAKESILPFLDEGIIVGNSQTNDASAVLIDNENMSDFDEQEEDERCIDSGYGSIEHSPNITPRSFTPLMSQPPSSSSHRRSFSINWMFMLSLLLLFSIYMYTFGVLIPSSIYVNVHHDRLPPQ